MKKSDVSFGKVFGESWNLLWSRIGLFASLGLLFSFLPGIIFAIWDRSRTSFLIDGVVPSIGDIFMEVKILAPWIFGLWIFSTFLAVCIIYILNNGTKKKAIDFGAAIKGGWSFYGKALLLGLLLFVFLVPLYCLLIIPGIVFQIYWMFAVYVLVAENKSIMKSLKRSHEIVKGRWWKAFGYMLLFYVIVGITGAMFDGLFSFIGMVGVFLGVIVTTLISIFSLIFVNSFYLSLKRK